MIEINFEKDLVGALQPIRNFVLASAIYHLFSTGIYDYIKKDQSNIYNIAADLNLNIKKLFGFFHYLSNENIIVFFENNVKLTNFGEEFSRFRGWYEMYIGGYGSTFLQIGDCLIEGASHATRNAEQVGVGSCAISHYDAFPLTKRIMSISNKAYELVLDIGCGNAAYLIDFCKYFPSLKAIGVEPDNNGCEKARNLIKKESLEHRISVINSNAIEFFNTTRLEPDLIIISFVLHEILGQSEETGVKKFLKNIIQRYPSIDLIIIEVDDKFDKIDIMQHRLALAYYNPYYLLHYFTNQKLATLCYWENLFHECGLEIIVKDHPNKFVDSTCLEVGFLLRSKKC